MKIRSITIREIFDSKGNATLEACVATAKGEFCAQVPHGESTGSAEAAVLPYAKARAAYEKFLKKKLIGASFNSIRAFDAVLLAADKTARKEKIGGNLTIVLSAAAARAIAAEKGSALWEELRREFFKTAKGA